MNCPAAPREALYESLHAAVRSFPSPNLPLADQQPARKAAQLILASQLENTSPRCLSTNLVHLQAMMFMAIEAENHSPATLRVQSTGSPSVWLGSAVGLAYSLKLHMHKQPEKGAESDPDSDDKLARRIWWSLVIMDRWRASGTASPLLIPDSSVVVYKEDKALLGESLYQLARKPLISSYSALF
jgi:hypothetical protein